jgi:hypothetical protein
MSAAVQAISGCYPTGHMVPGFSDSCR